MQPVLKFEWNAQKRQTGWYNKIKITTVGKTTINSFPAHYNTKPQDAFQKENG